MPVAQVNGIKVNYQVTGQGYPMVLIMGLGAALNAWKIQVDYFKRYFRVIVFDNRGVGKSDKPEGIYIPRVMAEDTAGLMEYLGIDKAHILGFSMGGAIAQEIAINFPEKVNRLILSSTFACNDKGSNGGTPEEVALDRFPIREFMPRQLNLVFNNKSRRIFYIPIVWLQSLFMQNKDIRGLQSQIEGLRTHNTLDRLSKIKCPTLVITGTKDQVVKPGSSDTLARMIPDAKLVKLENGSHMVCTEMADEYNNLILRFLKQS
jgi:pimeloyl-ACP methyl ester carboxylesterase